MIFLTVEPLEDQPHQLFEKLSNNHVNMNYTVDVCPEKFLNTKIIYEKKNNHNQSIS